MKQKQLDFRRGQAFRSFAALVCLLLLGVSGVRAQSRYEVSGAITDRNAQPVAGASVVEKGTNRGTVTSADGSYTIRVSSDMARGFILCGGAAEPMIEIIITQNMFASKICMRIESSIHKIFRQTLSFRRRLEIAGRTRRAGAPV